MQTTTQQEVATDAGWHWEPFPDVWWGEDGIDAMIWADGQPYSDSSDTFVKLPRMMGGEAQ